MGMRCEQTANEKLTKDCEFVKGDEFPCSPHTHTHTHTHTHFNTLRVGLDLPFPSAYTLSVGLCSRNLLSNNNRDLIEL